MPPLPPMQPVDVKAQALRQIREKQAQMMASEQATANEAKMLARNANPQFPPIPMIGNVIEQPNKPRGMPPPTQEEREAEQRMIEQDRLLAMQEAGLMPEPSMPEPIPEMPPPRQNRRASKKDVHPILKQLRHDLGLEQHQVVEIRLADHKWGFVALTPEMTTLALRIADMSAHVDIERALVQEYAAVACSIVSIDGVPVWQVFGVDPESGDDVSQPLYVKGRIRQRQALVLLMELMSNMHVNVLTELIKAYAAEVDPQGNIKGYVDSKAGYYKYSCPEKDCPNTIARTKRFSLEGQELPYFCEVHGTCMEIITPEGVTPDSEVTNPLA